MKEFAQIQFREIIKSLILEGKIFSWDFLMITVLFRFFLLVYGITILVLHIFLSICPSSYSILILYGFFLNNCFDSESWRKKIGIKGERKNYSDLTFSEYNHIQNFGEKKIFQHFANLIKIRSTHLLPIFYPFFLVARVLLHERPKKKIENREQVCRYNYTPTPRRGRGYTVLPLSVCLSVRPSFQDIFRRNFLSNYWW